MYEPDKAYKNIRFLNSSSARTVRILCEYEEPRARLAQEGIKNTIVMFGSARIRPVDEAEAIVASAEAALAAGEGDGAALEGAVSDARKRLGLARYYTDARELARRLTEWSMKREGGWSYHVCSGGGPGIMEAANRGAADVPGGRSVGLGISLPFEKGVNAYVTPELGFEFHYFFMRKLWFLYLAQIVVIFPGGFGTMDEMFETLTLRQTGKIDRPMPMVLYGTAFWDEVFNAEAMVRYGTISPGDVNLFHRSDTVDDAFAFITSELEDREATARRGDDH
jgi:uncharacterized protein (TIGR00730 family)